MIAKSSQQNLKFPSSLGASEPKRRHPIATAANQILSVLLWVILAVACAAALAVVIVPRLLGAVPLTVLTGSMRPGIEPGDLVVTRPVDPNRLQIGQIVTFQPVSGDPTLVTHRIVDLTRNLQGETLTIITRGDANGSDDAPLVPGQIMGRVIYRIPRIGYLTNITGQTTQLVTILGIACFAYAILTIIKPEKTKSNAHPK
jgi:signal peptidase I